MTGDQTEFRNYLDQGCSDWSSETKDRVCLFRDLVLEENEKQNLTRLLSPIDFYEGHVLDALELQKSGALTFPALDLGSGAGVPGLLMAIFDPKPWVITESETHKAVFLAAAAEKLNLSRVDVVSGRAEEVLKTHNVGSVTARAVGPVERIYTWIRPCSTWNNLVLLKGPRWEEEWTAFQAGKFRRELKVTAQHEYSAGRENKKRRIIQLSRVARG